MEVLTSRGAGAAPVWSGLEWEHPETGTFAVNGGEIRFAVNGRDLGTVASIVSLVDAELACSNRICGGHQLEDEPEADLLPGSDD